MIKLFQTMCRAFLLILLCATFFSVQSYAGESTEWSNAVYKRSISGVVIDDNGVPLPGGSVVVKGTTIGVLTDINGKFSIDVPDDATVLVVSFVGYLTKEVKIGNMTNIEVKLNADFKSLGDVVVVGYGTQSRALIASSMASVNSDQLKDRPSTSFTEALVGKVAGVQFQQTTGAPGGGFSVKIRGIGSITSNSQPLYVVDGVPIDNVISTSGVQFSQSTWTTSNGQQAQNPMASMNPNDIQSIDILKDAASTAIYGSRGSNGVVLITTKQGAVGKAVFSANVSTGIQTLDKKVDMMNLEEYVAMETQRRNYQWVLNGGNVAVAGRSLTDPNSVRTNNGYKIPVEFSDLSNFRGTDWQNELFQSAPMTSAQLSVSGGTGKTRYYLSGDLVNQDGIIINSGFKKFSLRTNVDAEITDKVKMGFKINPSYNISKMNQAGGYGGMVQSVLSMPPTYDAYNVDGTYAYYGPLYHYGDGTFDRNTYGSNTGNPIAISKVSEKTFDQIRLMSSAYISIDIIKHLTFKSSISTDINVFSYNQFDPSTVSAPGIATISGSLSSSRNISWVNENIFTYTNTFKEKHNLTVMGGVTEQKSYFEFHDMGANNFPNDVVHTLNAGMIWGGSQTKSENSMLSYLGRVSYDFDKKYLVSATVRSDGSSRFGSENRWGTFPSASVGWRVAQENFMKNVKAVSELKLRASYGISGNNNIGDYSSMGLVGSMNYTLGSGTGGQVNGLVQNSISNRILGWEQTTQTDIGMELGLFKNRVYLTADYYNSLTDGLLFAVPVPLITGFESSLQNMGSVSNEGIELSIDTKNVAKKDFQWNTNFNISFNRNNVESMGLTNSPITDGPRNFFNELAYRTEVGQPIGSFYGYVYEGVYKTQAEADAEMTVYTRDPAGVPTVRAMAGDIKYKDLDGNGIIDGNDQTIIGNSNPDFIWGLTNTLNYKGFDLGLTLQGVQGSTIMQGQMRNVYRFISGEERNYWKSEAEPGDGNTVNPGGMGLNRKVSAYWLRDGSFMRIKSLTIGYSLPAKLFGNSVSKARAFMAAENLFTFTRYSLYNPEVNSGEGDEYNNKTPGLDYGGYPLARTITFGLNVSF